MCLSMCVCVCVCVCVLGGEGGGTRGGEIIPETMGAKGQERKSGTCGAIMQKFLLECSREAVT